MGGEIFIVSGSGAFYTNKDKIGPNNSNKILGDIFKLDSYQKLKGTLIGFTFPLPIPDKINIYSEGIL